MAHGGFKTNFKDACIDFTSGSLGGVALVYVGQPFDTVKVKMQTFPMLYTNMFNCFKKTFKSDGIARGLYAGTVPALIANVAENSVLFAGYGYCQKIIMKLTHIKRSEDLTTLHNATAGFLAAFWSSLALCPTELLKCKLQAMHDLQKLEANKDKPFKHIGAFQLTKKIIRTDGIQAMFKGLTPTLVREMPGYFFFFGGYEGMRELLRESGQSKDQIGLLKTMVAGAVGGMIFWIVIFPADVVKSRVQVAKKHCGTSFHVVRTIFRNEGIGALYNGLLPTLCRTIPATAVLFATYEYSKKFLHFVFQTKWPNVE